MKRNFLMWVFLPGFFTVPSSAQVDIPPGVARISLIQGDVSAQRGDTGEWAAAALNQPLVAGDRISTGDGSRSELQLDHSNILRLANNAQAKIATVQRALIQVQVGQGLAYYTVFKDSEAEVEIDTPNAAIRPTSKDGVYRIEVHGFETQVIVRAGAADISTPQGSAHVEVGEAATVRGTTDEAGSVLGIASSRDAWDSWSNDRDGEIRNAQSWNYTNRYYVGSEDLDAYGHWINVPDYGRVWSPTVAGNWSPFRAGRWVSEPYWGWTWVSREPWGWTPYHYGRWFLYGKSWVWWPGPVDGDGNYRPEWAPAYVSFFGFGGHREVSAGFRSVGWLPIGPGDSFYPWYGQNGSQSSVVDVIDATSTTKLNRGVGVVAPLRDDDQFSNVALATVDVRIRKAIWVVPAGRFGTGRSVPATVSRRAFRDARIITGKLPMVPTRGSLSATNRPASPSSIAMMTGGRPERFFTKRQPPAAPQFLDRQAAQIQAQLPEGIQGNGALVPVREVTQLDSTGTTRPLPRPTPLEDGIERTVERTKNVPSVHGSRSQSGRGLRATPPPTPRTSRSTRRMMAPATSPRRATARAAQSYIDSANRQMDKGNYVAAIANYKRAGQVDGNISAAKSRLERARRAMQAENEIIANRR